MHFMLVREFHSLQKLHVHKTILTTSHNYLLKLLEVSEELALLAGERHGKIFH